MILRNKKLEALLAENATMVESRPGTAKRISRVESAEFGEIITHETRVWCQDYGTPEASPSCNSSITPYVVKDEVWEAAGMPPDPHGGFLCLACLSARLGRKLRRRDFTDYPVNGWLNVLDLRGE